MVWYNHHKSQETDWLTMLIQSLSRNAINIFIIHRVAQSSVKPWQGFCLKKTEKSLPSPNTGYCHCLIFRAPLAKSELVSLTKNKHFDCFYVPADGKFRKFGTDYWSSQFLNKPPDWIIIISRTLAGQFLYLFSNRFSVDKLCSILISIWARLNFT